jgi:hypothetical protein
MAASFIGYVPFLRQSEAFVLLPSVLLSLSPLVIPLLSLLPTSVTPSHRSTRTVISPLSSSILVQPSLYSPSTLPQSFHLS